MFRQNRGKRRFFSAGPSRWGGRFLCGCDSEESGGNDRGDQSDDAQSKHSIASSRLEKCCPPFAITQKFFTNHRGDKLIVQAIETSKVIDRALGRIFARS